MSTKTISITEEAYQRLSSKKKPKESFSEVINRLLKRKSLVEFAGLFSKKEAGEMEKAVKAFRAASRARHLKTQKVME